MRVKAERGTLDIVFANAGAGSQLPLGEIDAEHLDEIFDTNVKVRSSRSRRRYADGRGRFDHPDGSSAAPRAPRHSPLQRARRQCATSRGPGRTT